MWVDINIKYVELIIPKINSKEIIKTLEAIIIQMKHDVLYEISHPRMYYKYIYNMRIK